MSDRIILSSGEVALAASLAAIRQGVNREAGIRNQKAGQQDAITTELVGVLGELAFCKWANIYPDLTTHLRRGSFDAVYRGWNVDVKSTRNPHGDLWVDARKDKMPDLYVLVHVEYAACTLLGWVWSGEVPSRNYAEPGRTPQIASRDRDGMRWMWDIEPCLDREVSSQ